VRRKIEEAVEQSAKIPRYEKKLDALMPLILEAEATLKQLRVEYDLIYWEAVFLQSDNKELKKGLKNLLARNVPEMPDFNRKRYMDFYDDHVDTEEEED
jgi:hypothetical protein